MNDGLRAIVNRFVIIQFNTWIRGIEKLFLLEAWARDGLTDEQIAKNIGIAPKTHYIAGKSNIVKSVAKKE